MSEFEDLCHSIDDLKEAIATLRFAVVENLDLQDPIFDVVDAAKALDTSMERLRATRARDAVPVLTQRDIQDIAAATGVSDWEVRDYWPDALRKLLDACSGGN